MSKSQKRVAINTGNAKLKHSEQVTPLDKTTLYDSTLRNIPRSASDRFIELKQKGLVTGSFNAFIINSLLTNLDSIERR